MRNEQWSRDAHGEVQTVRDRRSQNHGVDAISGHETTRNAAVTGAYCTRDLDAPLDGADSGGRPPRLPATSSERLDLSEKTMTLLRRQAVI